MKRDYFAYWSKINFEDTKEVIRNRKLKNDRQYNDKRKKAKGQREA
jgi:hypothetical protein